ncbi:MAG TPA: aspartyl protease family protein [Candidatus Rubrimentiphilum sp.]|nr:aspartyl protease family protein [Candidatus Rubrimentiphilum sp.]
MIAAILVLHLSVTAYGVTGSGEIAVDKTTGKFVRRFDAGPVSEQEGFDGRRAWRADATGMARIEGNAGERSEILAWSRALASAIRAQQPAGGALRITIAGATDHVTLSFDRYRTFGTLRVPTRIVSQSEQNGSWTATVQSWNQTRSRPDFFAPPAMLPRDFRLTATTRVPVSMSGGSPVITATVNGKQLQFLLDTGGQNVLTEAAAKDLGLHLLGRGTVGGGGGGTASIRYATVQTVDIGGAELFHQPFIVLPANALPGGIDGIVGYELLARFAARLDMAHGTLELAPAATAFGPPVAPAAFVYLDRQPQVNGSLDSAAGAFSIDTGSSLTAQIQTPAVRKYDLVNRLHATVAAYANDVGGRYPIYLVRAGAMRLGSALFPAPIVDLLVRASTSNNSSIVGNVGDGILKRWVLVFDYAHQIVDFRPGGDTAGNVIHDHSGMVVTAESDALVIEQVLGGTPAADAGLKEGARITSIDGNAVGGKDLDRVRTLLRADPGTKIALTLADGSTHQLVLRQYL